MPAILPLTLQGVSYAAGGKPRIKAVSVTLAAGPRSIILGPNGAGKTLLIMLCHGLVGPTEGVIAWGHAGVTDPRWHQAMVFQRPVMLRRSVAANVDYALQLRAVPRAERQERIQEVLSRTGLHRFADAPARVLSFGEQQRVALARAWALRPQVLFLDEPTASLDPTATRAVEDIINAIHETGTKIVMSTHDLGQAHRLADEILFLHRGRLQEQTSAEVFFRRPATQEAAHFLEGRLPSQLKRVGS
ncbi:MAG: ATP-binding cassette domain-containing protein [Rhodospirillales bacterium]|nr:MAG: ATP-binding cassette domain-containing protein [Rhodospirillales bacterium]